MATIVFGAIGTALGGPIGGAIGALVGRQIDAAIIGSTNRQGPRLKELEATTSTYGTPMPRVFGQMRVPGTIIWATDLAEHTTTQGGGKQKPSVTTYNYTASFAVALTSRPILDIGRIWADGNLLRGSDGQLRAGGTMRVYTGHSDQQPDPLIAAVEGENRCPAWRGTAYVVFEDLELGDFFNRIPALTFEINTGESHDLNLEQILRDTIEDIHADLPLTRVSGWSMDGPPAETLRNLAAIFPMDVDAGGDRLVFARERMQVEPIGLTEAAIAVGDDDFGGVSGYSRKRLPPLSNPPELLRYYDIQRDYLPGLQRATRGPAGGQPQVLELPAALHAVNARVLVERMARRAEWSRRRIAWRTAEVDPTVGPGAIVTLPGQAGRWRVEEWEWRESGIELTLGRVIPTGIDAPLGGDADPIEPADPGRIIPPFDTPSPPTVLAAFELPWDGTGNGDAPAPFAAASAQNVAWSGAALFADHGDGGLVPLGPSGRTRSIIGTVEDALAPASPHLIDRGSSLTVALLDPAMELVHSTVRQLAMGANRALVGDEIIQFLAATALGGARFRLEGLLRGRGGTETAIAGHVAGERFVLLDSRNVALDPAIVGNAAGTLVVASGRGDATPVTAAIALDGITLRPLSPVHPGARGLPDGGLALSWTRRARGAWLWRDGVDVPLHEQSETYVVTFGPVDAPIATWSVAEPLLQLPPALVAQLVAALPGGAFQVRQQGSYALSQPLLLGAIS